MSKNLSLFLLFVLLAFSTFAFAQKNEVSLVAGGTVSPAMTDTGSIAITALCPTTQPNCGGIVKFTIKTKVKSAVFFEGAFARRDGHVAAAYFELAAGRHSQQRHKGLIRQQLHITLRRAQL